MNKTDLIAALAENTGTSKAEAARTIDALFASDTGIIAAALRKGEKVAIQGFGAFNVSKRAARKGVHPRTGAAIDIAESKSVRFSTGSGLKSAL